MIGVGTLHHREGKEVNESGSQTKTRYLSIFSF